VPENWHGLTVPGGTAVPPGTPVPGGAAQPGPLRDFFAFLMQFSLTLLGTSSRLFRE